MSVSDWAALFPPDQIPYHWDKVPIVGKSLAFLIANYVLEPVVIAVVALRFYSRTTMGTLGWDDWFVLIAKILCICTLTVVTSLSSIGSGYYVEQVAMNLSTVYLLIFILQGFFLFANMTVKLSVCFFYLRVFVDTIWNLNMRTSDKLGLALAFSIGIGMTVVGIIRAIYVSTTSVKGDITATLLTNLFLTVIEQQLAIITVSIPMLRPLWRRYRGRLGGYSLDESEQANKDSLPNGTFDGSGAKGRRLPRRRNNNTMLDSKFELGTVLGEERHAEGRTADQKSLPNAASWDAVDSGS
ncbi:uncharacterized protein J7T54_005044 [Emericellopsis cladophorae]|uniref:Rhodopsin domain-containing protein n=1 Tax=Emericellopsis cladophorae TaxID=2686198 RepID=A0A9Q0BBI1_9HYPO|nr:uncharacterized protein J7T54_005044 [Emericellopsis cladophorae]KAI6778520.1 hypothetical protein J7T54_005044 [Emericellopsis cladophorae]